MTSLATSLGVRFSFNTEVQEIEVDNGKVKGIRANNKVQPFDYVIASADYHHVEQDLLSDSES